MEHINFLSATEAAAVAASQWIGRGNEREADQAAVTAMRHTLNELDIQGVVVIGEGERDEAPMLYIGEEVGRPRGKHPVDIALDPLEGPPQTFLFSFHISKRLRKRQAHLKGINRGI